MYVEPNGIIKLIRHCPIHREDEEIYFENKTVQFNYFNNLAIQSRLVFEKATFINDLQGVIRLPIDVSKLYNVNYMMFQNNGFGSDKWFYAFVKHPERVADNISSITFEIDKVQTWFMQTDTDPALQLKQCYVEREHSRYDVLGENLVEENLATGDKVYNTFNVGQNVTTNHYDFNITNANRIMIVSAVNFADVKIKTSPTSWVTDILDKWEKLKNENPFYGIEFECGKVDRSYKYNNYISGARYFVLLEEGDQIPVYNNDGELTTYIVTKQDVNLAKAIIGSIIEIGHSDGILGVYSIPATGLRWSAIERSSTLFNGWDELIGNVFWKDNFPKTIGIAYLSEEDPLYVSKESFKVYVKDLDGYEPKNNKLYNFPYTQFNVTNFCGNEIILKPEMLAKSNTPLEHVNLGWGLQLNVKMMNTIQLPASSKLIFDEYKCGNELLDNSLDIGPYPVHSWRSGVFERWVAQNRAQIFAGGISTMMNLGSNVGTIGMQDRQAYYTQEIQGPKGSGFIIPQGNKKFGPTKTDLNFAGSAIANTATTTWNQLASVASASNQPEKINGNVGGSNVLYDNGKQIATLRCISLNSEYAKIIDDYFTVYGYACKQVKVPNISSRPRWNYVKTIGCIIHGDMPSDVNNELSQLFDNGVTFWKYREDMDIGNYELNNKP